MQTEVEHLRPPELVRLSHWEDRHEVRVANWITPWDFVEPIDVGITAVPIARAAIKPVSAHLGPNALRDGRYFFTTYSIDYDVDIRDLLVRDTGDVDIPLWDVVEAHERIFSAASTLLAHEPRFFPVFVGGDHSMTRPIVRAIHEARPELERLGLIQFDAHIDCQNFDDGGPHNGTPIRGIVEDDNGVDPRNIVQIGISGFVNAEYYRRYLVDEHGGTIFSTREVARRGIEAVLADAWSVASRGVDGVYVTFDIDSLELAHAPGTGAAVSGGLTPWQAMDALFELGGRDAVIGFDLVEVDPSRDPQGVTQRLANKLLLTFLAGFHRRSGSDTRRQSMVEQARLEKTTTGPEPVTDGWFVVNVRDARWVTNEAFGASCRFEGREAWFPELAINLRVLAPGQPNCLYHAESQQEDFLVLAGECVLLVEGEERRLRAWDFVHCPRNTEHVFVGAGDAPCVILMTGTRSEDEVLLYPVSELARGYGACVAEETPSEKEAYAPFPKNEPGRPDSWDQLPWATT